jgi:RNA polymerase sigma-70 factor (ECF subfamily)
VTQPNDPLGPSRNKLLGLAYRMLGSLADAEDVLQDAWLRFQAAEKEDVRSEEAYLVTIVTRLCLDRLKSAKAKREIYVGPWLPEPIVDADAVSPETAVELADDLSYALLLTLERLSGAERAAFLLHDVFDKPFDEVAAALGKSEAACRQLAARARKAVRDGHNKRKTEPAEYQALLEQFVAAAASGDASRLSALLSKDVVVYSDGGGVKAAALNPVIGVDRVSRFFLGLLKKAARLGGQAEYKPVSINGAPGLLGFVNGEVDQTVSIEVRDGRIAAFYIVRNPEKLGGVTSRSVH